MGFHFKSCEPRRWFYFYFKVISVLVLITNCSCQKTDSNLAPPAADDTPVTVESPAIPVTYVRKCLCNATELLESDQCVEHPMLVEAVFASSFNITVEDLSCDPPLTAVLLSSDDFSPVEQGAIHVPILDSFVPLSDHCIEYKYNLYGEITMEAKTCFAAPQLPVCCRGGVLPHPDSGEGLACSEEASSDVGVAADDETLPANSNTITLPVYVSNRPVDFGALETFVSPVRCTEGQKLTTTSIGRTDEAGIGYSIRGAVLEWITPNGKAHRLAPDEFCLSRSIHPDGESYAGFFCYRNPLDDHLDKCRDKVCVRKCCPPGSLYFDNIGCTEFPDPGGWIPPMHSHKTLQPLDTPVPVVEVYGLPICAQVFALDSELPFLLTDDGHLSLFQGTSHPSHRYCLDNMLSDDGTVSTIALLCFGDTDDTPACWWQGVVQMVALALSCAFILATLFVYLSVTEIFRRLPSKCVVSESIALLLSFLCLIILQAINSSNNSAFCVATGRGLVVLVGVVVLVGSWRPWWGTGGLVFYYATLASFFWLNVMCFDMYFTFRSIVNVTRDGNDRKWLVRYSCYGWGLPFVFLVAVCIVDNLPFTASYFHVIRPNIFTVCHIPTNDHVARWVYMYCPMLILLAINAGLFVHVAVSLVRQQRENARVLQGTESQARAGGKASQSGGKVKESAILCLKLFVVMGVTWVTEIISFTDGNPCYVWLVTDVINCLRGLFIFLIFVCKRDVIKKMSCRFKNTWGPRLSPCGRLCPAGGGASRPESRDVTDSVVSSSMWSSRKTSHTSLFGFGGRRKTSTASALGGLECHKMATVQENGDKRDSDAQF
ncbi:GPCR family 2 secretin-like [Trinorchestia longiramus]|nr:GPCR family 2 secretin-like [Trinorchestia longiramus]